ncbi:transporter substrate-binding protein [Peribacillus phoenicis]|uniref:transporter substrate-binding protein n=2 Tax=unclassified Peribacillus TaxID=2675266 RepID=UPI0039A48488
MKQGDGADMLIKVGLLFSLTGTTSITEKGQYEAAKFAIDECDSRVCEVEAIVRDICSDPIKSAQEAEALAKDGVKIFIGCYTSACRKAVLPVLEKYDCLLVYPTLYEGRECHPNVFYTGEVPNQQVHTLLDYLTSHYGKRVYCIGTDYIYPRETNKQVQTYLKELDGAVIGERYVPFGQQKFYDILEDIIFKKPDAIFSTLVGKSIIPFYRDYERMGLNHKKIPIFSPITKETEVAAMGSEFGIGHYSSASYFQSISNQLNMDFISKFHHFTGEKGAISSVMFNTYQGTKMIIESIIEMKSEDHRDIFHHLSGKELDTACGKIVVDTDHRHLARQVKIGKGMPDGQFEIVWDSERNISPRPFKVKHSQSDDLSEVVLKSWGQISEEAILVLSKENVVLYMSKKAADMTRFYQGQTLTKQLLQSMYLSFNVNHYEANHQHLYMLKQKMNVRYVKPFLSFGRIQTLSQGFQTELEVARIAAQSSANVLILGETGTGKDVIAQTIHEQSDRRNGPFIPVNAGLLPKDLIASELFGFTDGAFTGAKKGGAIGKFEAANNGTLFLDEIGDMPLELQVVLLRALETKKIVRLGETGERAVNVRIIAATHRNLSEEIAYSGSFRSDLFYRLNVLSITLLPLRERSEDMEHLCQELLQEFVSSYGEGPIHVSEEVLQVFIQYHWPGNIRELKNVLERAFLLAKGKYSTIEKIHLPQSLMGYYQRKDHQAKTMKNYEKKLIEQALRETKTVSEASIVLGIARSTLYRKIKEFKISM